MDTQTDSPPPLFTKREKYALAVLTLSFIVASALVHVVIGSVGSSIFPRFQPAAAAPLQYAQLEHLIKATPTPTPAPTPRIVVTAVPHEQQTRSPETRPPVHPPHQSSGDNKPKHGGITDIATPTGAPVVSPPTSLPSAAPAASPTPGAPEQIVDSEFIRKMTPDYPEIAKDENVEGTVTVRVTIGLDGQVEAAVVVQSSGSSQLDDAALKAARGSVYRSPLLDGNPTTRDYLIIYTFALDA
ncbi:MAG TPA: TonB family protein [Candidatus Eremiobacteraceae bacterium]|nr:TonB family protein [Candidatus Eremiobacteraceae bacterium]